MDGGRTDSRFCSLHRLATSPGKNSMKTKVVLTVCVVAIAALISLRFLGEEPVPPVGAQSPIPNDETSRPNIILIYSDDIDCESLFDDWPEQPADSIRFPVLRRLAQTGVTFTNFHVTTPVCGPSRACMVSGQYAHSNQVRVNTPDARSANGFSGGYRVFNRDHEIGNWLKKTGYTTAWVGKYLHDDFSPIDSGVQSWRSIVPAGWDRFLCSLGGRYLRFRQIQDDQDKLVLIDDRYRTDFEAQQIVELIETDWSTSTQPFFLCWAPYAAHMSLDMESMSAERHRDLFEDEIPTGIRDSKQFQDIRHQPDELASIPAYPTEALERWQKIHVKRLRAMQALDEGLGQMIDALKNTGKLDNTIIVFTSDHGFSMGQHRHFGKRFPYDRITKVPFIVCGPGVPANQQCDQLLANIDIAPTLVDLAGGQRPAAVDGISFAGLIRSPQEKINRKGIVFENWDRIWANGVQLDAVYCSLRTHHHVYTEWASGGIEFFDIAADPEQLENLYPGLNEQRRIDLKNQLRDCRATGEPGKPILSTEFIIPETYKERHVISASFETVPFSGFVEDDSGIDRVELELYCARIDRYWDGSRWSKDKTVVSADLSMPGGHVSRWSWSLNTGRIAFDTNERMNRRDVTVNVIATDRENNQTR